MIETKYIVYPFFLSDNTCFTHSPELHICNKPLTVATLPSMILVNFIRYLSMTNISPIVFLLLILEDNYFGI